MSSYKVVLAGMGGVGKTTFIKKHMGLGFEKKYDATTGVELYTIDYNGVMFNVLDIAGQERFHNSYEIYFAKADFVLMFYDVTNKLSVKCLDEYTKHIPETAKLIYVGNKCDVINRKIISPVNGACEISCKTGENISTPLDKILEIV